jgi:hypothetical protein
MPEYSQPLHSRQLQSFAEILRYYPEFPEGRRRWFDRVHFDIEDGHGLRPLSVHWEFGGPAWLRAAVWTLGVLGHERMRPAFRLARSKHDRVPKNLNKAKFTIPDLEELTVNLANSTGVPSTDSAI